MIRLLILIIFIGFHIWLHAQVEDVKWQYVIMDPIEIDPAFIGGTEEMYQFINQNIYYTKSCQQESARNQVWVQFIVDTTGFIINSKIMKDTGSGCNDEALRVVNLMNEDGPRWSPGEHDGRKVRMWVNLPIMFNVK